MKKTFFVLLVSSVLFFSCDNDDMIIDQELLVGTWEGENENIKTKWTFNKNGNFEWDYWEKPLNLVPPENAPTDWGWSRLFLVIGTYKYNKTSFTLHGESFGEGVNYDYQIDSEGKLILFYARLQCYLSHTKID